jgi:hypothetical protein
MARALLQLTALAFGAVIVFGVYTRASWAPEIPWLERTRSQFREASYVNADHAEADVEPVLNEMRRTGKLDVRKLRDVVIKGADRTAALVGAYNEARARASGQAVHPEQQLNIPPPPKPKPPIHTVLPTGTTNADTFIDGQTSTWTNFRRPIEVQGPLRIRAYGSITGKRAEAFTAHPAGLRLPADADEDPRDLNAGGRIFTELPFLALVGRICEPARNRGGSVWNGLLAEPDRDCSEPFLIGEGGILCPEQIGRRGQLHLLTNQIINGHPRTSSFNGGYWFDISSAPSNACRTLTTENVRLEAETRANGTLLRAPEFVVYGSQGVWKPFDIPSRGFTVKATGLVQMEDRSRRISGPAGADPEELGLSSDYVRRQPNLPYLAFMGRLCAGYACSPAFLVGEEKRICPADRYDRIELWTNDIANDPVTDHFIRERMGGYRFEFVESPCGGSDVQ